MKSKGVYCIGKDLIGKAGVKDLDLTRLIISAKKIGLTGFQLKTMLS